ncbi:heat shock transcription factor A4A [Euphorbia peplus]|nr:heat shock transcription factor A4A [Euphorbia peplus]
MDSSSSQGSNNAPAPFLIKTYEMIDDPVTNSIVSWSHSGCSFVVWNPPQFAQDLLPKYFKHNNFSSFVRQLNTYGFRKVDPDQWEFANEEFIRGQKHLLSNIRRRKPIHSHSLHNQLNISPLSDSEKRDYEDKIKRLKQDKSLLQIELRRNETEKQVFESQIMSYGERLQDMERRQMQLVSFLSEVAKKPGFASMLMQQTEFNTKKRRLFESGDYNVDCDSDENHSLGVVKENPDGGSPSSLMNSESVDKLDSSIKCLENFLYAERETFAQETCDFRLVSPPSPAIFRELSASSIDGETCSPRSHTSTTHSMDIPSSPELVACINYVESSPKMPVKEAELESKNSSSSVFQPAGANDHFWEYFLTEAPGSSGKEEPESQTEQTDGKRTRVVKPESREKGWWNSNIIQDLTMHMEHLAPAGRS